MLNLNKKERNKTQYLESDMHEQRETGPLIDNSSTPLSYTNVIIKDDLAP